MASTAELRDPSFYLKLPLVLPLEASARTSSGPPYLSPTISFSFLLHHTLSLPFLSHTLMKPKIDSELKTRGIALFQGKTK